LDATLATGSKGWTEREFAGLNLGDARLDKRAKILMERFAANPTASIPMACHSWSETCAAYRFLGNPDVEWRDMMAPHWEQTQKRMSAQPVVLCLQDTTELDFNGQETAGLGPLNYEARRGMYVHPTYAVTPQREPLGVLDAWMWAREDLDDAGVRHGQKESTRWIEGYERVAEMAAEMPATRLVYVADREADLVAMMARAQALGTPADWLVRAKHNRCLPKGDGEKLWAHTTTGQATGEIAFTMPARDKQKARKVRQQLWTRKVEISNGKAGTVFATCIVAREIDAPKGVKPVEWRLLTNRAAPELEDVIELINFYRARWDIEIYFNVLKNGCKVEALQLSAIDRIERALALFMIVAWRVTYLMRVGRTCPELDAALFFDPDEIRGAYLLSKKPQPTESPRLNEVLRMIAQLGGFLARKSDGEPGVKTIWQGLQRVMDVATALQSLREGNG
jgi:hypothetical protein